MALLFNTIIVIRMTDIQRVKAVLLFPFTIAHLNKHNREIFLHCKALNSMEESLSTNKEPVNLSLIKVKQVFNKLHHMQSLNHESKNECMQFV